MYTHAYLYVTTYIVMHTSRFTADKSYGKGMENIGTRLLGKLTASIDAFYLSVCTNKGKKLKNLVIQINKGVVMQRLLPCMDSRCDPVCTPV